MKKWLKHISVTACGMATVISTAFAQAIRIQWSPPGSSGSGTISLNIGNYLTNVRYGPLSSAVSLAGDFGATLTVDPGAPVWARGNLDGSITMVSRSGPISNLTATITPDGGAAVPTGISVLTSPGNITTSGPQIAGLSPSHAQFGTQVTISGSNLGAAGTSRVTLAGVEMEVLSYGASSIVVRIRNTDESGGIVVTVNGTASNSASFTVDTPPLCVVGFPS